MPPQQVRPEPLPLHRIPRPPQNTQQPPPATTHPSPPQVEAGVAALREQLVVSESEKQVLADEVTKLAKELAADREAATLAQQAAAAAAKQLQDCEQARAQLGSQVIQQPPAEAPAHPPPCPEPRHWFVQVLEVLWQYKLSTFFAGTGVGLGPLAALYGFRAIAGWLGRKKETAATDGRHPRNTSEPPRGAEPAHSAPPQQATGQSPVERRPMEDPQLREQLRGCREALAEARADRERLAKEAADRQVQPEQLVKLQNQWVTVKDMQAHNAWVRAVKLVGERSPGSRNTLQQVERIKDLVLSGEDAESLT